MNKCAYAQERVNTACFRTIVEKARAAKNYELNVPMPRKGLTRLVLGPSSNRRAPQKIMNYNITVFMKPEGSPGPEVAV